MCDLLSFRSRCQTTYHNLLLMQAYPSKNHITKDHKRQDESSKLAVEVVSNLRTITTYLSQAGIIQILKKAQEAHKRKALDNLSLLELDLVLYRAY